jgi:uncharacterized C2H2 Zn-finger protein
VHDENSNNSVHVEQKPFDREHCGLGFETEKDLKKHIESVHDENCNNSVHDEQKSFDCEQCGVGFETEKDLKKHTESVHGENHQFSLARLSKNLDEGYTVQTVNDILEDRYPFGRKDIYLP